MIAIGIDGLINRGLLCPNVVLRQYNNRGEIRKGYIFRDVFPTNIEGYTIDYDNESFMEKSVTFAFRNYEPLRTTKGNGPPYSPVGDFGVPFDQQIGEIGNIA